jgi:hypothetical protein
MAVGTARAAGSMSSTVRKREVAMRQVFMSTLVVLLFAVQGLRAEEY